ncbi:ATP-binding cassette domain-containing protein [Cryobacterium psychrophilum]|nr:ATP-binding cassette domain-containing protein [Cryobacterium psychrophilum]
MPSSRGTLRHAAAHPVATVALVVLATMVIVAAAGPLLAAGRAPDDQFLRLAQGTREAVVGGVTATLVTLFIGTVCGLLAGTHSGRFDAIAGWMAYLTASVPAFIFLVVVVVVSDSSDGLNGAMLMVGVLATIPLFLLVRSAVRAVRASSPGEQTRGRWGLTTVGLLVRSVLPALRSRLIGLSLLVLAVMVTFRTYLGFLGPVDPVSPTWGAMLRNSLQHSSTGTMSDWSPLALLLLTAGAAAGLGFSMLPTPTNDPALTLPAGSSEDCRVPAPSGPGTSEEPLPSTWFRSSALLDVRGLRIAVAPDTPEIVSGVSLTIAAGQIVGLLGGSDSGALEIALAASGLLAPATRITGGSILFNGVELVGLSERDATRLRGTNISYIPRAPAESLDGAFSIGDHLQAPLRKTLGLSRAASKRRSLELLDKVGFTDPRATFRLFPDDLTPLMAQRVLIAGAISCDPALLVADNPTLALDPVDVIAVIDLLHKLQDELAFTLMIVTESVTVLAASCRHVAVVQAGTIVEHASVPDLLASPQHDYTRRLVATAGSAGPAWFPVTS